MMKWASIAIAENDNGTTRYAVQGDPDLDGVVSISYEAWDKEKRVWHDDSTAMTIKVSLLEELLKAAKIVVQIEG